MAWFGESLANLKGSISSFTKEVLSEDGEDESSGAGDETAEVQKLRKQNREYEEAVTQRGMEVEILRSRVQEQEEVFHQQITSVKASYQKLLEDKDEENKRLREQLGVLEITFKQLENKKNASDEKVLELQLENAAGIEYEKEKEKTPFTSDSATNTEGEYDEFYTRELEERCTSYQNELFLLRNELMSVQHHADELEETKAKLNDDVLQIFQTDFSLDGQPVLPITKFRRRIDGGENGFILSALKQLASLWKDLAEKKYLLERTVTKLSQKQKQEQHGESDSSEELDLTIPNPTDPSTSTISPNLDAFIPAKIDSFGCLETILEEERNEDESRGSESGFTSRARMEEIVGSGSLCQRSPSESPSPVPLIAKLTTSTSSQTELVDEVHPELDTGAEQDNLKAEIEALAMQASDLMLREQELLRVIEEKESQISRLDMELTRLRTHMVETEDQSTADALASQAKTKQLESEMSQLRRDYMRAMQDKEPNEDLRDELVRLTGERNEAWTQSSTLQDQTQKLTTQLQNLHFVLEQFQKEKEIEIGGIERRCRADMNQLEQKNEVLRKEMERQESLLEKAKSGLDAAAQLNAQIEERTRAISTLKTQVQERDGELSKLKSQMGEVAKNLDGKIDRYLVKNLVVGYFSTPSDKRKEVLRVLATVLDFNREDRQKTNLESTSIWPFSRGETSSGGQDKQSLSEAFIHFLESESQPKVQLRIPAEEMTRRNSRISVQTSESSGAEASSTSSATPPRMSPTLANSSPPPPPTPSEMFMSIPVLSQVDRSNSILKDVLNPKMP